MLLFVPIGKVATGIFQPNMRNWLSNGGGVLISPYLSVIFQRNAQNMNKLRISLSQKNDEIKGTIETPGDPAFVLECLALAIEHVADKFDVSPNAVVNDLYSIVTGKVR